MTTLTSSNLSTNPGWINYTNTKTEIIRFLSNLNIDCESDKSKEEFSKTFSSMIFDDIGRSLFDDRILKKNKLTLNLLKNINSITGEKLSPNGNPENFSQGVQILVANALSPWLEKSKTSQDSKNNSKINSEINNIYEKNKLSEISSKLKSSMLDKSATELHDSTIDNDFNNDLKILKILDEKKNSIPKKHHHKKNKNKNKKTVEKKSEINKSNILHARHGPKKKKKASIKKLPSKPKSSLLDTPVIYDVHQDISGDKQLSITSSKRILSWLKKSATDFHDSANNVSQTLAEKSNKPEQNYTNKQLLNNLNKKKYPSSKKIFSKLKLDTSKGGKLKKSMHNYSKYDLEKKNLTMDEYDVDNITGNKKNGTESNIVNKNSYLNTSGSIDNSKFKDINKTDIKPMNGKRKEVIYSGNIMNKLMKLKLSKQTKVKTKKLKVSSSIGREGKLVSKINVKPVKLKRSTPITSKGKIGSKSKVVLNKTREKISSNKKTKNTGKLSVISKKNYYFNDNTIREYRRPADEVLLKSISHTKLGNNNEFNIGQDYMEEKINVNNNKSIYDKENNNKLCSASYGNKNRDIVQNYKDDKYNIIKYIPVEDRTSNEQTNIIQDNTNIIVELNSMNEKTNVNECKIIYNKLANITQGKNKTDKAQKPMDEKTSVNEYKTVYENDCNILLDIYIDKKNTIPNFIDKNTNVHKKITTFDIDSNLTNKVLVKDKYNVEQKYMDENMNVYKYGTIYDKYYNTLVNTNQYNYKQNVRSDSMKENMNVNEKIIDYGKDHNKLTNNAQDKNKSDIGQESIDENTYTESNRKTYNKNYNKYSDQMKTDEPDIQPLKPLSPIIILDGITVNNKNTTINKKEKNTIVQLDINSDKLNRIHENQKSNCNEPRNNVPSCNVNNEILNKIEEKFKSRILDDKIFWDKWIKCGSMDYIEPFKATRPEEGSKYRDASNETKKKEIMECEEIRIIPGIINQIRKKNGSDFSLSEKIQLEIIDSMNNKYSDYCNDIRLSKLCGIIHPIITGPPIENNIKLSGRPEDLGSWEHNFDKCICQNKLTKMLFYYDKV